MTSGRVTWDGYLSLDIPEGWEWQEDDGTISIFDPEGVGAIQISFATAEDPAAEIEPSDFVRCFAEAQGFDHVGPVETVLGALAGSYFEAVGGDDEPSLWRVWSAGRNGRVATVSYTCGETDKEVERDRVDAIIGSVEWSF